nr:hypothetical protein [Tanacetum cinerariifolium]
MSKLLATTTHHRIPHQTSRRLESTHASTKVLGIFISTTKVYCSCCQVYNSAAALFLLPKNAPPKNVPEITTITNISAKSPYLKKGEYDIWAMKMQNFISSSDLLCWNIVLKGNKEHQQVQREEKDRTILLSALSDEHMGDFYHMIDARDIWDAIKARFGGNAESKKMQKSLLKQKFKEFKVSEEEGLDKGYDKMQKILTQMNTLKIKHDPENVNMKFLRGLPSFWSEIDTKGYSSSFSTLSNAAFVSTGGSNQGNISYLESRNSGYGGYTTTLSASTGSSSFKGSSKSKCSVVDDVIYSFFANHEIDQQLVYKDLDQMNKDKFEEYDLKHQMAMPSIKVHRFEKKHRRKIKFNGRENARFDKKLVKCFNCKQMGHFSRECRAQGVHNSNNYQKYKSKEAGKNGTDSKAMVVVDGSIDWDKLQALVDKKKVVVTEATIREALRLDDAESVECLPNEEIFVELARMGYEKPSTKLTFYKAFFSSQKQVGDLSTHTTNYTFPALSQKVFANMRRVGKGFSGVETPLFEGILVAQEVVTEGDVEVHGEEVNAGDVIEGDVSAAHREVPTADEEPSIPSPTPFTPPPQPSHDIPSTS